MLVLPQTVNVKWHRNNKKWYFEKGYIFTNLGDMLEVNALDLPLGSSQKVIILCDFCNETIHRRYSEYANKDKNDKDSCVKCRNKKNAKYTIEDVKKEFKKRGFTLLEGEYINSKTNMRYICDKGHETKTCFSSLLKGIRCKKCAAEKLGNERRKSIEEVRKIFEENNCVLLSTEYKKASQKLKYICECGNESEITLNHFQRGERCWECRSKKLAFHFKHDYEYVYNYFEEYDCLLLEDKYINSQTPMRFICDCGRESSTTFGNFTRGVRCKQCAIDNMKGENHPNWNPDLTVEERENERNIEGYSEWRNAVYKRDSYTCQSCQQVGGNINAHHLDGYHWCKDKRTDINNGVTLCDDCHTEFHSTYGKRNNTKEQFEEWIKNK
jgi:hypothetical protein